MSAEEQTKLAGKLALVQAESGIKGFISRIIKSIKAKGITLAKILRMYAVVERAVKEIEAIAAEK